MTTRCLDESVLLGAQWTERVEEPRLKCFGLLSDGSGRLEIGRGGARDVLFRGLAELEERDPRK